MVSIFFLDKQITEDFLTPVLRRVLYLLVFLPTFPAKVNTAFAFPGRGWLTEAFWKRGGRIFVL